MILNFKRENEYGVLDKKQSEADSFSSAVIWVGSESDPIDFVKYLLKLSLFVFFEFDGREGC